ncbi:probable transmembrane ascorbate ferrireductase 4 [Coffea eugenioides]|uniref:probable transmembrane ascorbate ferrireductase 4 n=1 Tax=Coffea eugenioides TaxID=49369 RepID=UPI000F605D0C|nr:probable transmembrane ascorbate ferrireductase 4 [Coffea eugenioides]
MRLAGWVVDDHAVRGAVWLSREWLWPWGSHTYALAVVTAETGLLEKLTFLQTRGDVLRRCTESMVVNGLGLGLALLSGIVILAAVLPKHEAPHFKMMYTNNKCLSSQ